MSDTVNKEIETVVESNQLYEFSRGLILNSRKLVYQTANFAMVETYWKIGEKIVEEQGGEDYAKYGENLLISVSARLRTEFGKGFTYVNLTNMRKFYLQFPNVYALRKELKERIQKSRFLQPLVAEISWSKHLVTCFLRTDNMNYLDV